MASSAQKISAPGSLLDLPFPKPSQAQVYAALTKLEKLTYRIGYLSNFLSAAQETLELCAFFPSNVYYFGEQIIAVVEAARETLKAAKVVPYLWASCPEKLVPHKAAYIDLLRMLQSSQRYVDTPFQGRLRTLLIPLTSHFFIPGKGNSQPAHSLARETTTGQLAAQSSSAGFEEQSQSPSAAHSSMLPPSAFPHTNSKSQIPKAPNTKRLWHADELLSSSSARRSHIRPKCEREKPDQENVAPVAFRPARSPLRFGICFSAKSSMYGGGYKQKDCIGRPSSVRSLMNPKE